MPHEGPVHEFPPDSGQMKHAHEVLDLPHASSKAEVRARRRKLSQKYHPDVIGDKEGLASMKVVSAATDEMLRPSYMSDYEEYAREEALRGRATGAKSAPASGPGLGDSFVPFGQTDNPLFEEDDRMRASVSGNTFWEQVRPKKAEPINQASISGEFSKPGTHAEAAQGTAVREWGGLFYVCDSAGNRLSEGYEHLFNHEGIMLARTGERVCALNPETGQRVTGQYEYLVCEHGTWIGAGDGQEYVIDPKTGHESQGYGSIAWVASFEREDEYLIGIEGEQRCLIDRKTGNRLSIMYDEILKRDKRLMVGTRGGKEYLLDQGTGKELSTAFDRIERNILGQVVGIRSDLAAKQILDKDTGAKSGEKKKH